MKRLFLAFCGALALFLWYASAAPAGDVPHEPILRIETGMHTSQIWSVATDAANRYLVTGAQDKTVRVWDVATNGLLQTLRPPIGASDEGAIFAVALSPDGKTVACAGATGSQWDGAHAIYLFSRSNGKLFRKIGNLPNFVLQLRFSPDGQFLAAGMSGSDGIRLYRTADYQMVGQDNVYGGACTGLDFGPLEAGQPLRLATASYLNSNENYIRLYAIRPDSDKPLVLTERQKPTAVGNPTQVSFAPDGSKIAVGFNDAPRVVVLSGTDLSHPYTPDTSGTKFANLKAVSWSADGQTLYASGDGQEPGNVLKWAAAGRGQRATLVAASDTIRQLIPFSGGVAFASAAPAFGMIGTDDTIRLKAAQRADFRGLLQNLLISQDGSVVQFAYAITGQAPARFSIKDRRLWDGGQGTRVATPLLPPQVDGLGITDWQESQNVKLNGALLKMDEEEVSHSLAIAPDRKSFVLGTRWNIRRYDPAGKSLWKTPVPTTTWSVNISGDGKVAVAALGDGTLRWYRMSDGQELCDFFPAIDKKRWVLWTPSGYYDTSPGGEELIGWHLNRSPDAAADFFSVARFRSTYYRPDVIAQVLPSLDEVAAVLLADDAAGRTDTHPPIAKILPPVVSIIAPPGGLDVTTTAIKLSYTVRTPSGEPVTEVKILVDGRPIDTTRDFQLVAADDTMREATVNVPMRDCLVSVIAYNRFAASEPVTVPLHWKGQAAPDNAKPRLFILAIGVSKYPKPDWELQFSAKDAHDFQTVFQAQNGGMYGDVQVKSLTDAEATRAAILAG
ncbi:MAG: hypothetical protein JOZ57_01665, partial [Abitibacteriaceae bacterium]|nr:hypothetical protein [Abditibacteriaceae bacterium]